MSFFTLRRSSLLLGTTLIVLFFSSCSKDDSTIDDTDTVTTEEAILENEILELVNAHRNSIGKNSLALNNRASELAQEHTLYMINKGGISHDNFNERADILFQEENAYSVGENVAAGYATAQSVMTGWLNSTGHRDNIEGDYTHIGVSAIKNSSGTYYYTQLFLKK